ncbi:PREDICTED: craniofacial development protein 2-like [Diuraphis noxia]|uniref:craniofacial development protein 2-like n=1 Tax=Diuraphis noxia TaxID=143948 RepID=UPI00076385CB|nr:PREDICTED: craniofacial development protein 2-like [Diuraphis noxia]
MRWAGTSNVKSDNLTLFYSGPNNGKHENGVDYVIKDSLINQVKKFEPVNDRLCHLTIIGKIFDIVLINCYAPTESVDEDLKDAFYETLERIFNCIPAYYIKIVLGDMNTQVGR